MAGLTFITGNQGKADFLARHVGSHIPHQSLDLDENQSLNLQEVAEHKARQAYGIIKSPVLVEDVGFSLKALNGLPGPFIKWFEKALGAEGICKLADSLESREVTISVCFCYFDGQNIKNFEGSLEGNVAQTPRGTNGFGFDPIFIRKGQTKTFAEMTDEELEKYSLRTTTVYPQIKKFLDELDKIS